MPQSDHEIQRKSPSNASTQTVALVEKAREGDRLAFEKLAGLFYTEIFRMVYFRTLSKMDAEDLTQDIFIQAFKSLPELKTVERFKSWLFSIAVNRVRDFHRKKKFQGLFRGARDYKEKDNSENTTTDGPDALTALIRQDFWKNVGSILSRLPAMEKEVFILRFLDQFDIKEISRILNKNESTVKTHLYRALKKFRESSSTLRSFQEDGT